MHRQDPPPAGRIPSAVSSWAIVASECRSSTSQRYIIRTTATSGSVYQDSAGGRVRQAEGTCPITSRGGPFPAPSKRPLANLLEVRLCLPCRVALDLRHDLLHEHLT